MYPRIFSLSSVSLTLASRGSIAKTPPAGENFLPGIDYGRDGRFRAQIRLGSHAVLTSYQERFAMQLRGLLPDSRSGLIIADFTISLLAQSQALEYEDSAKVVGISCRDALSVGVGFWACFFETSILSTCPRFFDPCWFPLGSA